MTCLPIQQVKSYKGEIRFYTLFVLFSSEIKHRFCHKFGKKKMQYWLLTYRCFEIKRKFYPFSSEKSKI